MNYLLAQLGSFLWEQALHLYYWLAFAPQLLRPPQIASFFLNKPAFRTIFPNLAGKPFYIIK